MTENTKSKKSLKKRLSVAITVVVGIALVVIFLAAVFRPNNPTTTPEEMQAAIKELVAQGYKEEITNSIGMKLRLVPPGTFLMGAPKPHKIRLHEICAKFGLMNPIESVGIVNYPKREVTITEPFYMSVHEITQEQYEKAMGKNPSHFRGKNLPVETVSWDDATEFCAKLSDMEKTSYSC